MIPLTAVFAATFALAPPASDDDPFADLRENPAPAQGAARSWEFDTSLKKELYAQLSYSDEAQKDDHPPLYNRHSAGFELLTKLSSPTATVASFDFQGRLVFRDNFIPVINDAEGEAREGWFFEYHNAYADIYNALDLVKKTAPGTFNLRAGRFYLPMGINLATDTHGTLLQLSNERNLGFERDWYAGLWGSPNAHINYDIYYLVGSGYDLSFKGQGGLFGGRVSLGNMYLNEYGLEGGVAVLSGERISEHAVMRSPAVASEAGRNDIVSTLRVGPDVRYSFLAGPGSVVTTAEITTGRDESDDVFTQLYEVAYRPASLRWEVAGQFRRFWQDIPLHDPMFAGMSPDDRADTSVIGNLTWYFRNDLAKSHLHWIALNVEQQLERQAGPNDTIVTLQYYLYW